MPSPGTDGFIHLTGRVQTPLISIVAEVPYYVKFWAATTPFRGGLMLSGKEGQVYHARQKERAPATGRGAVTGWTWRGCKSFVLWRHGGGHRKTSRAPLGVVAHGRRMPYTRGQVSRGGVEPPAR